MLLEVSDMTTSEVWPFLFIFSIFHQKNATIPNLSFVAFFCQKKLEQGSTLQHGETAIENGDVSSPFLVGLFQIS
jgi:hypothetical protein